MTTMETDLPFLSRELDRHGNDRLYVRRNGKRIRIRVPEGTPEFAKAYSRAVDQLGEPPTKRSEPEPSVLVRAWPKDTFGWLANQYFASKGEGGFLDLDEDSRRAKRNMIDTCLEM